MAQHPIISGLMAMFVVAVIILIFGTLIFLIIEIIDKLCCKFCYKFCLKFSKKIYYKIKDRKSGVRVAPQIKIVEAKTTELPVTSGAREIFVGDAIEV